MGPQKRRSSIGQQVSVYPYNFDLKKFNSRSDTKNEDQPIYLEFIGRSDTKQELTKERQLS